MNGPFEVRYTDAAREDLLRLFDHLLATAHTVDDLDAAQEAIGAIRDAVERCLARSPFLYRKSAESAFLRELLIPFRQSGYVALYEIDNATHVTVLAVRHQREDDYH